MEPTKVPVVLLVEDDLSHAELIVRGLGDGEAQARVHHVRDGAEALDYLFRRGGYAEPKTSPRPDLVLLDLNLPRLGGVDVLRAVKERPGLRSIPVVVLTTSVEPADVEGAYHAHANSFLVKPADFQGFRDLTRGVVAYWLGLNRGFCEV